MSLLRPCRVPFALLILPVVAAIVGCRAASESNRASLPTGEPSPAPSLSKPALIEFIELGTDGHGRTMRGVRGYATDIPVKSSLALEVRLLGFVPANTPARFGEVGYLYSHDTVAAAFATEAQAAALAWLGERAGCEVVVAVRDQCLSKTVVQQPPRLSQFFEMWDLTGEVLVIPADKFPHDLLPERTAPHQ